MATAPNLTPIPYNPLAGADVMRRGIKRVLPCKLTDAEQLQISKQRVAKEALREQIVEDFDKLKGKHKAQLEELDSEIAKAGKELHTEEQDRTVLCTEVFRAGPDGAGWVHTLRMDVLASAYAGAIADAMTESEAAALATERARVEQRPATPTEAQRYLPGIEGAPVDRNAPLLDQAAAMQAAPAVDGHQRHVDLAVADGGESDGVPEGAEPGGEDDGLGDQGEPADAEEQDADDADDSDRPPANETPAQRSARESEQARAQRRGSGKKRGRGGKAGK